MLLEKWQCFWWKILQKSHVLCTLKNRDSNALPTLIQHQKNIYFIGKYWMLLEKWQCFWCKILEKKCHVFCTLKIPDTIALPISIQYKTNIYFIGKTLDVNREMTMFLVQNPSQNAIFLDPKKNLESGLTLESNWSSFSSDMLHFNFVSLYTYLFMKKNRKISTD